LETQFTIQVSDFKKVITEVKKLSPKSLKIDVPISIQPDRIEFLFVGMSRLLPAITTHFCDVVIPFRVLDAISKTADTKELTFQVEEGKLEYGRVSLTSKDVHIQSLFLNSESSVPMNSTPKILLGMRRKHSEEYLKKNGYLSLIIKEEKRLDDNLKTAVNKLKDYGITYQMLRELVQNQFKKII
jgi:hypothetical protein